MATSRRYSKKKSSSSRKGKRKVSRGRKGHRRFTRKNIGGGGSEDTIQPIDKPLTIEDLRLTGDKLQLSQSTKKSSTLDILNGVKVYRVKNGKLEKEPLYTIEIKDIYEKPEPTIKHFFLDKARVYLLKEIMNRIYKKKKEDAKYNFVDNPEFDEDIKSELFYNQVKDHVLYEKTNNGKQVPRSLFIDTNIDNFIFLEKGPYKDNEVFGRIYDILSFAQDEDAVLFAIAKFILSLYYCYKHSNLLLQYEDFARKYLFADEFFIPNYQGTKPLYDSEGVEYKISTEIDQMKIILDKLDQKTIMNPKISVQDTIKPFLELNIPEKNIINMIQNFTELYNVVNNKDEKQKLILNPTIYYILYIIEYVSLYSVDYYFKDIFTGRQALSFDRKYQEYSDDDVRSLQSDIINPLQRYINSQDDKKPKMDENERMKLMKLQNNATKLQKDQENLKKNEKDSFNNDYLKVLLKPPTSSSQKKGIFSSLSISDSNEKKDFEIATDFIYLNKEKKEKSLFSNNISKRKEYLSEKYYTQYPPRFVLPDQGDDMTKQNLGGGTVYHTYRRGMRIYEVNDTEKQKNPPPKYSVDSNTEVTLTNFGAEILNPNKDKLLYLRKEIDTREFKGSGPRATRNSDNVTHTVSEDCYPLKPSVFRKRVLNYFKSLIADSENYQLVKPDTQNPV